MSQNSLVSFEDFDRYVGQHGVQPEEYGEALPDGSVSRWEADQSASRRSTPETSRSSKIASKRELDGVPSFLAIRDETD